MYKEKSKNQLDNLLTTDNVCWASYFNTSIYYILLPFCAVFNLCAARYKLYIFYRVHITQAKRYNNYMWHKQKKVNVVHLDIINVQTIKCNKRGKDRYMKYIMP